MPNSKPPKLPEIYVSTDVETDGPCPGPNSMLSFASAAFTEDGQMLDTFTRNLETLFLAQGAPRTMDWWKTQPEAWEACRRDPRDPAEAMLEYLYWLRRLPGKPVFVAYPAGFDFTFVYWYLFKFTGAQPFGFSALDIKTMAATMLKLPYTQSVKRVFPKSWASNRRHNHTALDDAIEQGEIFCNMLKHLRASK